MSLTKIGSIGINTGIQFAGVTTVSTLHVGSGVTLSSDGDIFATGISTFSEDIKVGSGVTISPDGDVFFTGIATGNGSGLTALNASNLGSGTVPTARLGSGTASSSTFLRGDSTFQTVNTDLVSDTSPQLGGNLDVNTKNITFGDSSGSTDDRLTFGAGTDLSIYHTGNASFVDNNNSNNLFVRALSGTIYYDANSHYMRNAGGTENMLIATQNAGVQLLWDNSTKLETISTGIRMQNSSELTVNGGTIQFGHSSSSDDRLKFGANDTDLQIFHGGNGQFDVNTGDVIIRNTGDFSSSREIYLMARVDEQSVTCKSDGAVELYHDNVKKLATTANGTTFSNTTDDAAMNDCILLTRRGYELSGYGTKIQVMGGSADSQNGIRFAHSHSNGGGYTVRQRFDHDGIKFNGDTAAANGLDDYEEGTFTPTIYYQNSSGITIATNSASGKYTKIGRVVWIIGYINWSVSGSPVNDNVAIQGLPFSTDPGKIAAGGTRFVGNISLEGTSNESTTHQLEPYGNNGVNIITDDEKGNKANELGGNSNMYAKYQFWYHTS